GGSMEQMTTYTFISNVVTAILIPLCFPLIEKGEHLTFLSPFFGILYQVCIVLVVPMGLAFIVKHGFHRFHHWIVGIKDLSFYLWGGSLVLVAGTTMRNIMHANTSLLFVCVIAILGLMLSIVQFATG
ncbi:MAG TPA: transporter, partial [Prevotella sp.]|nr:transporter [Candidatus Segatella violae]